MDLRDGKGAAAGTGKVGTAVRPGTPMRPATPSANRLETSGGKDGAKPKVDLNPNPTSNSNSTPQLAVKDSMSMIPEIPLVNIVGKQHVKTMTCEEAEEQVLGLVQRLRLG